MARLTLIAAVGSNGVIGDGEKMLWHLPEDFAFFKKTTMGHPMIMGRATFESIGRVLPGRRHIVLTRQPDWQHEGVEVVGSLVEALALLDDTAPADEEVFIIGGGQVYAESIAIAHRLLITEVDQSPAGTVTFPPIAPDQWRESERSPHTGFAFVTYERTRHIAALLKGERVGRYAKSRFGASGAVRDADGRLLLTQRSDNGLWCLPGGAVDPGETWAETVAREVWEETGLTVRVGEVLTAYTDPNAVVVYPDGRRAQIYAVCFAATPAQGAAGVSDEVLASRWCTRDEALALPLVELHRPLVELVFAAQTS